MWHGLYRDNQARVIIARIEEAYKGGKRRNENELVVSPVYE